MKHSVRTLILSLALIVLVFSSCMFTDAESIRVYGLKGPTGMGLAQMMVNEQGDDTYQFDVFSAPDVMAPEILSGNFDIAMLPTNLASTLYEKTNGALMIVAVNTLGVLHILENGDSIDSIADLDGKTIYATGQGSTPQYVLEYILEKNGVTCEIVYLADHTELASKMIAGTVEIGMLPVPNATTVLQKNPSVRAALDLSEEWDAVSEDSALYQGCVVVRRSFAEQHPAALKEFLNDYKKSVDFVSESPDEAALMMADLGIIPSADIALVAIPDANIVCITGNTMKSNLHGFFSVLYEANPSAIGGKIPDEDIYYIP